MTLKYRLPKISLNDWYGGKHWSERSKIKNVYKLLVRGVTINYPCEVEYDFEFKTRPLDCSNTVAMLKLIEDCLFPDDGVKIVRKLTITSRKSDKDEVTVKINKL